MTLRVVRLLEMIFLIFPIYDFLIMKFECCAILKYKTKTIEAIILLARVVVKAHKLFYRFTTMSIRMPQRVA